MIFIDNFKNLIFYNMLDPNKPYILTAEGYAKLAENIKKLEEELKSIGIKKGEAAGPSSDWHDNPAYEEFDNQERMFLQRQASLKERLLTAEIVDLPTSSKYVEIGSTVQILLLKNSKEQNFTITDPEMTDPSRNRISYQSPLGSTLIGKKAGEIIDLPTGPIKILDIRI